MGRTITIPDLEPMTLDIAPGDIEQQLARLLESHHFRHSHRYPVLLKYLVEQTLAGRSAELKERLVGIDVFRRAPDYDTNTDPVVRVTAAEVRKRIAQYYQEPGHASEIRIDIPTGSYVPHFSRPQPVWASPAAELPGTVSNEETDSAEVQAHPSQDSPAAAEPASFTRSIRWWYVAIALCVGALLTYAATRVSGTIASQRERAMRDFWAPLSGGDTPVFVVIGDHTIGSTGNALRAAQGTVLNPSEDVLRLMNDYDQVTVSDVISLFSITEYMIRHEKSYTAVGAGAASFDDLRKGPVLLFAGLDNRWTMRLTEHLRYRFVDSPNDAIGTIEDSQNPSHRWQVDFSVPYSKMPVDYAIVAKYFDPLIEQPVIVVAGIGQTGTATASEFVTSERAIDDMNKLAPKGWKHGNVEVVLQTSVIDGHPGPPHIVASQFW
ncbi:MAG TPA: hypothetical protein VGM11_13600 [Acidobacteriaceae bacterium]|jgi:hypothetical protein